MCLRINNVFFVSIQAPGIRPNHHDPYPGGSDRTGDIRGGSDHYPAAQANYSSYSGPHNLYQGSYPDPKGPHQGTYSDPKVQGSYNNLHPQPTAYQSPYPNQVPYQQINAPQNPYRSMNAQDGGYQSVAAQGSYQY